MATIKSYTSLEQSKKLAEILPLETADMYWFRDDTETPKIYPKDMMKDSASVTLPCWSLAALLNVLPKGEYEDTDLCFGGYNGDKYIPECFCSYEQQEHLIIEICHAPNPVDACYELILKLHELNLL